MDKHLHVVSFDVPFPADYGGVIDVFYKLKALHAQGVKVHLHAFSYGREQAAELKAYCDSVHYYKRDTSMLAHVSMLPYIVKSRNSEALKKRLLQDDFPILMEGLHTTSLLLDQRFAKRQLMYRESNIEHQYYKQLAERETSFVRKTFFKLEAWKLERYEPVLRKSSMALVVSKTDTAYLQANYPGLKSFYLPSFHPGEQLAFDHKKEPYVLFHGNLSVGENIDAAVFLASVLKETPYRFIIAGKNPSTVVLGLARNNANIQLFADPDDATMRSLVNKAQVNVLYTKEAAGLKLKLLNVLFNGGHVLCNQAMLEGTDLEALCSVANDKTQFVNALNELMNLPFSEEDLKRRSVLLFPRFSNEANAKQLIELVFGVD